MSTQQDVTITGGKVTHADILAFATCYTPAHFLTHLSPMTEWSTLEEARADGANVFVKYDAELGEGPQWWPVEG